MIPQLPVWSLHALPVCFLLGTQCCAADGLPDNVVDWEKAAAVSVFQGDGDNPQTVAEQLADLARINANLTEGDSPFAASARAVGNALAQVQEAAVAHSSCQFGQMFNAE